MVTIDETTDVESLKYAVHKANGRVQKSAQHIAISAPNFQVGAFLIRGVAPLVQNRFSEKARQAIKEAHEAGQTRRSRKPAREPKDFDALYEAAMHISEEGWHGIPAPAFRNAMVSACRTVGYHMTKAKLAAFVEPDGFDVHDGTPLVRISKGMPFYHEGYVRNATGVVDIRPRPMWAPGWEALVRVRFDADMFTLDDVANLLMRAGMQVGIGEGRPDSPNSNGQGWGLFVLVEPDDER